MYRKKTLRQMQPTTRKVARLLNELESVHRRLVNLLDEVSRIELDSRALQAMTRARRDGAVPKDGPLFEEEEQ